MAEIKGIRTKIYFLRSEEGGRKSIIFSGYRPSIWWDGLEERGGNDGQIILEGRDTCFPGEECVTRVEFYYPELLPTSIKTGMTFTVREGGRVIGRGQVIDVF